MRVSSGPWPLIFVALAVVALVSACRALGFGEGVLLGATPASGMALGAALVLRWRGAAAAAVGFVLAGLAWGLTPAAAAGDAAAHGLAALIASVAMRGLARRREVRTRTNEWLIFLAGACVFTAVVASTYYAVALSGAFGPALGPLRVAALAAAFEPLGVLTFGAVLASLGELARIRAEPRPAIGTVALALFLLGTHWLLLRLPMESVSASGVTLLVAIPFCLWIAMQRRSLDGAALSFLAAHVALLILLGQVGSILRGEYVTALLYLNLLVATCQLVHAVNLDRLGALEEVEARKRDLEARVVQRTARLSAMTERALAADAAKMRFVATVSHEVRTPLNGVLGMASVVLTADLDPETRRNVEIIRTSGFHLLDVINRLLDFSRLDQGRDDAETVAFDLREVIDEVLGEARFLPYAQGLELRAEIAPALATRRLGNRQGLRQVLTNLVGNAAKFTDAGSVRVRAAAATDDAVRIEVRDTGVGVPPAEAERIFLPFEQSDAAANRRQGGTGLGLAICAEVVRRMGGRIGVESGVGGGSLFWIELPLPLAGASTGAAGECAAES